MVASAPFAKTRAAPQIMPRQESRWKENPVLAGAPHALWPWLTDPASLTARIVARCARFEVRVLRETAPAGAVDLDLAIFIESAFEKRIIQCKGLACGDDSAVCNRTTALPWT